MSDARLVRQVQNGNREAFGLIIDRHFQSVFAVALALVGNRSDAEDIVQDTFVKAIEAIGSLRDGGAVRAWLTTITRNTARNWLIRKSTERAAVQRMTNEALPPAGASASIERREYVDSHLAEIGEAHREVLLLRYYAGLTDREISDSLGITREAVRKRLQRAREALGLEMVRGLRPSEDRLERLRLTSKVRTLLGLSAVGWQFGARASASQWAGVLCTCMFSGVAAVIWAVSSTDSVPDSQSPTSGSGGAIVQAQADADDAKPHETDDSNPGEALSVRGRLVHREGSEGLDSSGTISGITIMREDGMPVADLTVRVERLGWNDYEDGPAERMDWTTATDAEGKFSLAELPLGSYGIEAHGVGLIGIESARIAGTDSSESVTLKMEPALPLGGRVQNERGLPISGAVVYLYTHERLGRGKPLVWDETTTMRRYTNQDGRFTFEGVHLGAWTLLSKAEGFAPELSDIVEAGTSDVVLLMGEGGSVSGVLRRAVGAQPLPGVTLSLRSELARYQAAVVTSGDGAFTVPHLREGDYHIIVDDPILVTTPDTAVVRVEPLVPKSDVDVRAREGGHIKGRVFDAFTRKGLGGVPVFAEARGAVGLNRETVSADDGSFEIAGLGAGDYMVIPDPPKGYRKPSASYVAGRETRIDLDVPWVKRDCDLEPTAEMRGRVVTEEGEPVAGASVWIGGSGGVRTESDLDGSFRLDTVPRSRNLFLLASKGNLTSEVMPFETESEQRVDMDVVLHAGAIIEGRVVDDTGAPVTDASVYVSEVNSLYGTGDAKVDGQGRFSLPNLPRGEYLLWAAIGDETGVLNRDQDTRPRISVEFGDHIRDFIYVLSEGGRIGGVVVDAEGHPIEGAMVRCAETVKTDAEGRFETGGIFAEHGHLSVMKAGYLRETLPRIPVGTTDVVVTMVPWGVISGRIIDAATGEVIPVAQLEAVSSTLAYELNTNRMAHFRPVELYEGGFVYPTEVLGDLVLIARAEGYGVTRTPLHIEPGESIENLELALQRLQPLDVLVVHESGSPVAGVSVYQGSVAADAHMENQDREGVTDASGRLSIATYESSGGEVCAYHPDYGLGRATHSGEDSGRVTITLSNTAVLKGVVLAPWGGLEAITARITTEYNDYVQDWMVTPDASGMYRIERAPVGDRILELAGRYASGASNGWSYRMPVDIRLGDENVVDIQVPLGMVSVDVEIPESVPVRGRLTIRLTQPTIVPGLTHSVYADAGAPVDFVGVHPGPATLEVYGSDGLGGRIVLEPIEIRVPESPEGPLVVGAP